MRAISLHNESPSYIPNLLFKSGVQWGLDKHDLKMFYFQVMYIYDNDPAMIAHRINKYALK